MRLIDADELKTDLMTFFTDGVLDGVSAKVTFNQILHDIDNAPTVKPESEVFEWCTDCKEYDQENHCCHRWSSKIRETVEELKQERPTGKWKERESDTEDKENGFETVIVCSHCDFPATTFYSEDCESRTQIRTNFCPNCGAKMKGTEE